MELFWTVFTGHFVPGGSSDIVVEPVLVNVHTEHDSRQQHQDVVVDDLHNEHCQVEHQVQGERFANIQNIYYNTNSDKNI